MILQNTLGRSVTFFFVCLLVVIFVYADSISKNPGDGTDETDEEKRINQELYYCWWDWAKWAVLVAVFLTGAGIVFAVLAGQQIFYISEFSPRGRSSVFQLLTTSSPPPRPPHTQ